MNARNVDPGFDGPQPEHKEILNFAEAARFLGISTKTLQKVLRDGEIPGRKVGREWKFSRDALTRWIGDGRSADFLDASDRSTPSIEAALERRRRAASNRDEPLSKEEG